MRDIVRRFSRGLHNLLTTFGNEVSRCICLMNDKEEPILIFEQECCNRVIHHDAYYHLLLQEARL